MDIIKHKYIILDALKQPKNNKAVLFVVICGIRVKWAYKCSIQTDK